MSASAEGGPRTDGSGSARTLVEARAVSKRFVSQRNAWGRPIRVHDAVRGVSLQVPRGRTVAVVGESGAGKSTLGRMLLRLIEPDEGTVTFDGVDLATLRGRELRRWRRRAQMIFQDPFMSLDPQMTVAKAVAEPMVIHGEPTGSEREARVVDLLQRVGMGPEHLPRYPTSFSGGQLQRIAIARALATWPELIVCDEPVAALDMSIRAGVINLLRDLQAELDIAYVFVSHDLSLVRAIAHDVVVMRDGVVVEAGEADALFQDPRDPYTRQLLASVPIPDPRVRRPRVTLPAS